MEQEKFDNLWPKLNFHICDMVIWTQELCEEHNIRTAQFMEMDHQVLVNYRTSQLVAGLYLT